MREGPSGSSRSSRNPGIAWTGAHMGIIGMPVLLAAAGAGKSRVDSPIWKSRSPAP